MTTLSLFHHAEDCKKQSKRWFTRMTRNFANIFATVMMVLMLTIFFVGAEFASTAWMISSLVVGGAGAGVRVFAAHQH